MNKVETVEAGHEEHGAIIKTPKQLIITIILSFILPVIIILLLVKLVVSSSELGTGSDAYIEEAVAKRIAPIAGFHLVDLNAPKVFKTGQQVYESTCTACHAAGIAGAHKLGDAAAWAPAIAKGYETMLKNALQGIGGMPAKGGNTSLSDFEVERAVVYMLNQSGQSYPEPAEPAAEGEEGATEQPAEAATTEAPATAAAETTAEAPAVAESQPAPPSTESKPDLEPNTTGG